MRNGNDRFDKMLRYIWKWNINKMNDHLPRHTETLDALLKEERPIIEARDGTHLWTDRDELLMIASLVPEGLHNKLHLPIILTRRIDLGEGLFSISGGELERLLVTKILGSVEDLFSTNKSDDAPKYLYRREVQALRKKLRTLSVIGFAGADEQEF